MRRPFIAGNWKMNLSRGDSVALAKKLAESAASFERADVAVFPPYVYLDAVAQVLQGSAVKYGAQNCFHAGNGAFTGEVSIAMLVDLGCTHVIIGHSERRQLLGESNREVNRKVRAALAGGLTPIVCVGETDDEREAGKTTDIIQEQLSGSLAGLTLDEVNRIVIAYEPVWAIGTGKVASPQQAQEVHAELRKMLSLRYNAKLAAAVRIQYGGSVKPENAAELLAQPDIDGALVGGASLKAEGFLGIIAGVPRS